MKIIQHQSSEGTAVVPGGKKKKKSQRRLKTAHPVPTFIYLPESTCKHSYVHVKYKNQL